LKTGELSMSIDWVSHIANMEMSPNYDAGSIP
jgi:hypothetical protein